MVRRPVSIFLLGALFFAPGGCYRAGVELPVPRSAADSSAIVRINWAGHVYIRKHSGITVEIENAQVAYPMIIGRLPALHRPVGITVDSIAGIKGRNLSIAKTVLALGLVAAGVVGLYYLVVPECQGSAELFELRWCR